MDEIKIELDNLEGLEIIKKKSIDYAIVSLL